MSVPSFQNVKLWKTKLGSGAPKFLRKWKKLRIAPPAVGFGLQSSVECEPQPQCLLAGHTFTHNTFFLRVTSWKTKDGRLSTNPDPGSSAVRKWNNKKADQQVYLNDIIMTVNGHLPESNLLEEIDKKDKDMRVSLQILAGFVTFPSLVKCTGQILLSKEFTFSNDDPKAPKLISSNKWRKLLDKHKKKSKGMAFDAATRPARVFDCERLCLADPACDAIEVVTIAGSSMKRVLCQLVQDDEGERESTGSSSQLAPTDRDTGGERTCWLRTRLAKHSSPLQEPAAELPAELPAKAAGEVADVSGAAELPDWAAGEVPPWRKAAGH